MCKGLSKALLRFLLPHVNDAIKVAFQGHCAQEGFKRVSLYLGEGSRNQLLSYPFSFYDASYQILDMHWSQPEPVQLADSHQCNPFISPMMITDDESG